MRFLAGKPAMLIGKSLALADLHIGIECRLGMECKVKSIIKGTIKEIKDLLKETKADELIIMGDVKHRIMEAGSASETSELEWKIEQVIPLFFKEIEEGVNVRIIRGNHDGRLKMDVVDEIFIQDKGKTYCLIHGHKAPSPKAMETDFLVMAHAHPAVSFIDKLGKRSVMKAWIRGKPTKALREKYPEMNPNIEFIVMPAFNGFITGSPVNEEGLVGPLLKKQMFKISKAQLFLLNGVEIDYRTLSKGK